MLDVNFIRDNPEKVKKGAKDKRVEVQVDELLKVDQKRRKLLIEIDELRQQRNLIAKDRDIEKGKQIKEELGKLEEQLSEIEDEFKALMLQIPNLPLDEVQEGGEEDAQELKTEGEVTKFSFTPKDHLELGESLDIIDVQRASKVSGSRFAYLKNRGVLLELALVRFAMDNIIKEGFSPVIPPVLIKQELTDGLGYWQSGGNENYYLVSDYEENMENPLYLIGTGEHSIVPMHKDETLSDLPKKYLAFSSCFRREAGSYGKDTRGILRVHQFDKVEMVAFVMPEDDEKERRKLLGHAESLLKLLELPYRVVRLARGDTSFPAAETVDIETWMPSQNRYRETHSISTTTDFQSRRLNIKFDPKITVDSDSKKPQAGSYFVHILNGTALAIGRTIIAILENYQQEDGSVKIPEILIPYTGFSEIKPKG